MGVLLIALDVLAFGASAAPEADLCTVLSHREEYLGKVITVRGEVVQFEHGRYLVAQPRCAQEPSGVLIRGNFPASGPRGIGRPAIVEGILGISTTDMPRLAESPYLVLSVGHIKYGKPKQKD